MGICMALKIKTNKELTLLKMIDAEQKEQECKIHQELQWKSDHLHH